MNASVSPSPASPDSQKKEDFPASLKKLQQLLEYKVNILQAPTTEDQQAVLLGKGAGGQGLWSFAVLSQELTFHLQQLQKQTQQELSDIQSQLVHIEGRQQLLSSELLHLQEKKKLTERELKVSSCRQTSTGQLCVIQKLQASVGERLVQSQHLVFQEKALSALQELLSQDLHQYQEQIQDLSQFTQEVLRSDGETTEQQSDQSMQEKNDTRLEHSMATPSSSSYQALLLTEQKSTRNEEEAQTFQASYRESTADSFQHSYLQRAQSIKDLVSKFSIPELSRSSSSSRFGLMLKSLSVEVLTDAVDGQKAEPVPSTLSSTKEDPSPAPSIALPPPSKIANESEAELAPTSPKGSRITARIDCPVEISSEKFKSQPQSKAQPAESGRDSVEDSGMGSESEFDSNKQLDSPSEEEPSTPKAGPTAQNPKYQLFLNNEMKSNGLSGGGGGGGGDADGPGGGGLMAENGTKRWETNRLGVNSYKGSLESLASRDWDNTSDKFAYESPPRVFNSPYATATSMEYNPMHRMSEFKVHSGLSPATSEMNLYSFNSRSTSPVGIPTPTLGIPTPTLGSTRPRFSAYDSLVRRRSEINTIVPQVMTNHYSMRSNTMGGPNRRDYIEELTKELDSCQKRNQFLEAESVEMEKERNQIRFEMRGLLVNNEDLLRTNAQLSNEMKRMREQMIEMDQENQAMAERCREMEIEVKGARDMMVEANTQEYAFNVLQQSLHNKIQDAEENLEKQTLHAKSLAEKLWLAERRLEELEVDKDTKTKRTSELHNDILRLETELSDALQASSQASTELSLQQKLRADAQMRVDELEETLLEKEQELQRLQVLVSRLQGEVSGKLIDKERTLEDEIQLRERLQLQCKQAERTVDDLTMELQTTNQARDDLAKQLKLAQEKMIDMETDLEELHDSEQRWAAKQKRAIEQTEQLQMKVIQEKELNDQLEIEKTSMERQLRELRLEVDELQSSRVQEDVVSRAESRAKELESFLRAEERNKITLTNTISKLERRINELSDQMEEEHRIATEQKDLMTQRIRSLKRQLNEAEEEASRKEAQYRHTHRELTEERETSSRLQRQLLDQHLQNKRVDTMTIRQTLDNLRLDLSVDEDEEQQQVEAEQKEGEEPAERAEQEATVTKV